MTRFTKCLPDAAEQLPSSAQFSFSKTQIGPCPRNIFEAYSVIRETFTGVHSSIPVQLVTGLLQVRYEKPRGGSRGAMTRSLSGR